MSSNAPTAAAPSAVPPPEHARRCCLRCSQQLSNDPNLICAVTPGSTKCSRCINLRKTCRPVPPSFVKRLKRLVASRDCYKRLSCTATSSLAETELARTELYFRQCSFNRDVATFLRNARRQDQAAPSVEVAMLMMVEALDGISHSLEDLVDIMCQQV
ncbi:hypothetical protein M430DRAFT_14408 [Amorphotheca resinae ATCC 22711]|jgi:hypothetical protein|uniref:Uncharacterized protein n=1 Tax=Amorphotheca resinae ATCC 22711 TaxID=857342 RepID=A0A2T3BCH0_AMORE|nr:hypothetical protein M430DRAFT_14408 [Amorphotheca resinae ATCC 22711]PSS27110.1 hypothetical protein M430DRAFT_14408 [Amorphotheca resinae ATCC 22711]